MQNEYGFIGVFCISIYIISKRFVWENMYNVYLQYASICLQCTLKCVKISNNLCALLICYDKGSMTLIRNVWCILHNPCNPIYIIKSSTYIANMDCLSHALALYAWFLSWLDRRQNDSNNYVHMFNNIGQDSPEGDREWKDDKVVIDIHYWIWNICHGPVCLTSHVHPFQCSK